jgi:hypothetical protein
MLTMHERFIPTSLNQRADLDTQFDPAAMRL